MAKDMNLYFNVENMQLERKRGSTSLTIWKIPIRTSVNGIIICHKSKEKKMMIVQNVGEDAEKLD